MGAKGGLGGSSPPQPPLCLMPPGLCTPLLSCHSCSLFPSACLCGPRTPPPPVLAPACLPPSRSCPDPPITAARHPLFLKPSPTHLLRLLTFCNFDTSISRLCPFYVRESKGGGWRDSCVQGVELDDL
ncbi:Hypothetical predicted protein [Podarcis lilfordi]|uniref:Uncharacterized protein n=1 Tax=Podarcis lilfordi TaxID=74358 RepID=A0AA35L188_9SAUR|nr:Hypothetical predicted protein [Podarcis lilfordi]